MKKIILTLIIAIVFVSCGEETKSTCPKDYHVKEGTTNVCEHDAVDCSSMAGTFDNHDGDCISPCKDVDCGEGGTCKGSDFDKYVCECEAPNTLGDDKICHAPANFSDHKCYNEIKDTLNPIDRVASTDATFNCTDNVCDEVVIDSSAGGSPQASSNPWIYISLSKKMKVELNDSEAFNSVEWDLAFKRTVVRANGNDSGVGNVEIARIDGAKYNIVDLPLNLEQEFMMDSFMDSACVVKLNRIGNPTTAIGDWYDYQGGSNHGLKARDYLYFVKSNGVTYKFKFLLYNAGTVTVKYAPLN